MDASSTAALIEVQAAVKIFAMGEVQVAALRGVDLTVRDGEFLVIVGPSGSGKSTLLNLIGGMDRPTKGHVLFQGRDLAQAGERELTLYRRNQVGFVFQFFNLIPSLTALENVQVAVEVVAEPLDALEALETVGLADRASHFPSQLSGGEQQRVAIARAMASNPRLLLCDEPTGALDSETGRKVLSLLWDLHERLKKTVIVITHNHAIARIAPRVIELVDGRVAAVRENPSPAPASEIAY